MNTKLQKKLYRNIGLDYIGVFIQNMNMQGCIWVLYLSYCGMNLGQIGILEGVYHITSMMFEIPSGAIADLLARKKSMVISRILVAVSCLIMLISRNFWLFALSFFIQALGNNFNSGSEEALVYDSMKAIGEEKHYIGVSGRINVLIEVSQGIATVLGGILAEYSFAYCYGASLIIAICALIPVLFMTEPPIEKQKKKDKNVIGMLGNHFKLSFGILKDDSRILETIIYFEGIFTVQTLLFFYSQQYFSDMGYNKIWISVFMLLFSITSCVGALLSEKIYIRYGNTTASIAAFAIAIAICSFVFQNVVMSVIALSLAGFCNSVLYPIQSNVLNQLIPSEQRATLISVNSMFFSIGMIILFPIAGFLADYFGLANVFALIGGMLVLFIFHFGKKMRD